MKVNLQKVITPRVTTQELWRRLHYHALHEFDPQVSGAAVREATWLLKWARDIPTYNGGGCRCKEHWNQWYAKNRPTAADYASAEAYFAWTVKAHNSVNV
jgi:hypothetical protein